MQLITEYATPAELTGYVRAALADRPENQLTLERWLPNATINDLTYRLSRGGGGLTEAAGYRSWDAESDIATRPGSSRITGELPPISRKIPVGEYERIRRRGLDGQRAEIRDAMMDDGVRLARQIEARVELARGSALFNGSVTLAENGLVGLTADFGRNAAHSVTAVKVWSDPTADIIADLSAWLEVYVDTNGERPANTIMSLKIYNWLRRNAQLRGLSTTGATAPSVLTSSMLDAVLQDYGFPAPVIYDARVSVAGVSTRVTPEDKIAFVPAPGDTIGKTLWGVPVEGDDPRYGLAGDAAGIAVGGYKTEDPQTVWTRATAIVLPVAVDPDRTFVADVL
ncbi:major capsid protein [Kitasatospora sp. NPDC127111]|uniref:major capsid protein n=1 Tax=Kitasatospora sp. NPDC127111 TaxID=3345363 RepID=UPI003632CC81